MVNWTAIRSDSVRDPLGSRVKTRSLYDSPTTPHHHRVHDKKVVISHTSSWGGIGVLLPTLALSPGHVLSFARVVLVPWVLLTLRRLETPSLAHMHLFPVSP